MRPGQSKNPQARGRSQTPFLRTVSKSFHPGTNLKTRALAVLASAALLLGQETKPEAPDLTLHINVNLIQVDALVTDSRGRSVRDLKASDFEILEDGKPQRITNFSFIHLPPLRDRSQPGIGHFSRPVKATDVNRTIVIVADDLGLSFESVAYVRRALKQFVDRGIQEGDLVAILRTSHVAGAVHGLTTDKAVLREAVDAIRWNPAGRATIGAFPSVRPYTHPGVASDGSQRYVGLRTQLSSQSDYETNEQSYLGGTMASLHSIVRGLRDLPGRKELIVFSDGVPIAPAGGDFDLVRQALHDLADYANRSSVVLNTVDARGLQIAGPTAEDQFQAGSDVEATLDQRRQGYLTSQLGLDYLAGETGGRFIHDNNDLGWALDRILEDSNEYYLIGFKPDSEIFSRGPKGAVFHRLKVRVLRPGLHVRSRTGFYGIPDEEGTQPVTTPAQQLEQAVQSPFTRTEIPLKLTCAFESDRKQAHVLLMLHADAGQIEFAQLDGNTYLATFDVLVRGYNQDGPTSETAFTPGLSLTAAEKNRVRDEGLNYMARVPIARPGGYTYTAALRDRASGRIGSASAYVLAPNLKNGKLAIGGIALGRVDSPEGLDTPAAREFQARAKVPYRFSVFNTSPDPGGKVPPLTAQIKLFRDGREVYSGPEQTVAGPLGTSAILGGTLDLATISDPGDYDVQVVATGKHGRRALTASAWTDLTLLGTPNGTK